MREVVRIGACQTPDIIGDVAAAVECIEGFCAEAAAEEVDLLLFPEGFLQGYLLNEAHLRRCALELGSAEFRAITARLADVKPALVIGVIERAGGSLFNSAVVIERGNVSGVYRKTHLMRPEAIFDPGAEYPVFAVKGVGYGINICFDAQFADAAASVARQGARVLLLPSANMLEREAAERWKHRHNEIRAQRVRETGMWLVSADVTGQREGTYVSYGPTSVMNPAAEVVAHVPLMETGMVIAEIPAQPPDLPKLRSPAEVGDRRPQRAAPPTQFRPPPDTPAVDYNRSVSQFPATPCDRTGMIPCHTDPGSAPYLRFCARRECASVVVSGRILP